MLNQGNDNRPKLDSLLDMFKSHGWRCSRKADAIESYIIDDFYRRRSDLVFCIDYYPLYCNGEILVSDPLHDINIGKFDDMTHLSVTDNGFLMSYKRHSASFDIESGRFSFSYEGKRKDDKGEQ